MIAEFLATKNSRLFSWINKVLMHCDVDPRCHVPKSIKFGHGGRGVVIGNATLGENVLIMHNVTIGNNFLSKDKGFPKIGNDVKILTGALIIGNVTIGDNAIIGAGTTITKDVPPNSVVYADQKLVVKKHSRKATGRKFSQRDY